MSAKITPVGRPTPGTRSTRSTTRLAGPGSAVSDLDTSDLDTSDLDTSDLDTSDLETPITATEGTRHRGVTLASAIGSILAVAGFVIGSRAISDNSFFTHFANGRQFWEGEGIPHVDPYSFTAAGLPVTVQSWLASVLYAGLSEFVGEWSLRVLNGVLCLVLVVAIWALAAPARHLLPRVAVVGPAIVLGTLLWSPRPLLFGLLGLAAMLLVVDHRLPKAMLLPVMWIWVNTHGSFPLAVVVLLAMLGGQVLDQLPRNAASWRAVLVSHEMKVLGWTCAGIALGGLNPLGPRLLWFPVALLEKKEALRNVIEWSAPTFETPAEWGFLALIGLLVVAAKLGAKWRHLVPGFLMVLAGLIAIRNVGPAAIVLVWAASPALSSIRTFSIDGAATGLVPRVVVAVAATVASVAIFVVTQEGPLDLRGYPQGEVTWLEERALVANPQVRLLTRETDGNYLEMRFGDRAQVFVDDRFDFYPQDVLDDLDVLVFGGDFGEVLDRRGIDVVLWEDQASLARWIDDSGQWFVAHRTPTVDQGNGDRSWLIACRVTSAAADACRR